MPETPIKHQNREQESIGRTNTTKLSYSIEDQPSEFKLVGFEMLDREVKQSGKSGRVYLPKDWIGKRVKIIRVSRLDK